MRVHEVRSIEIETSFERAFAFIANPQNLPKWAHAFEQVDGARARMRTPRGATDIELTVESSQRHGTVDWRMVFPDGSVATAMSRLTPASAQRLVYTFVLNAPPLPMEEIEGALEQQVHTLERELAQLRELLTQ